MKKPCFFILGAAKCGTTSLYEYLNSHPDVYMSIPKEPLFFEGEYQFGLNFYLDKYYKGWNGQVIAGEARHRNLYLPYVAERIYRTVPNAKLIVILRNPVDRAYAHWWHWYSRKEEVLSFEDAISEDLKRIEQNITFEGSKGALLWSRNLDFKTGKNEFRTYIDSGYYCDQINRYFHRFPKEHIRVICLEELHHNMVNVVSDIWEFLGVNSDHTIPKSRNYNEAYNSKSVRAFVDPLRSIRGIKLIPEGLRARLSQVLCRIGNKSKMSSSTRKWLVDHYSQYNRRLEQIINKDLSHWNR